MKIDNIPGRTNDETEKGTIHVVEKFVDYVANSVLTRTILKKDTGNVTISALAAGQELDEKKTPFDNYVQVIDGAAEIFIDNKKFDVIVGEGIVIPAHCSHYFLASQRFKMISTVIKSGYED